MNLPAILTIVFAVPLLAQETPSSSPSLQFFKGVDVSALPQIEDHGGSFRENGSPRDPLAIFRDHGVNYVRLRLWHTPAGGDTDLQRTIQMARRARSLGLKFLLDMHYSDTWADPGRQTKPLAWQGLSFQALKDSVYRYTCAVIATLKSRNALPDMVQVGNEVTCGMLWDDGRVCDVFNTTEQWARFADLIREGIRGVRDSLDRTDTVKVMVHIDRGGDNGGSRWFLDRLLALNVDFDVLGLSYYPWWHGTLSALQSNLNDLAQRYGKDIVVVETGYPWTLAWNDSTHNIVGDPSQLHAGYPATVDGQRRFLGDVLQIVNGTRQNKGRGVFYWAPEWITAPGAGSPWENVAMFDFSGEVLNSVTAFEYPLSVAPSLQTPPFSPHLDQNYPNPFNPRTTIVFSIPRSQHVTLRVFNVLGEPVATLVSDELPVGTHAAEWDAHDAASGVYFYRMQAGAFTQTRRLLLLR